MCICVSESEQKNILPAHQICFISEQWVLIHSISTHTVYFHTLLLDEWITLLAFPHIKRLYQITKSRIISECVNNAFTCFPVGKDVQTVFLARKSELFMPRNMLHNHWLELDLPWCIFKKLPYLFAMQNSHQQMHSSYIIWVYLGHWGVDSYLNVSM